MAKRKAQSKLSLDNDKLTDEFFEDTRLIGITAPLRDYLFCGRLNDRMRMEFRVNHDVEIQIKKKSGDYFFPVYQFCEPTGTLTYYIYNNQFGREYLLPECKHFNFLLLTKGDIVSDERLQETINALKEVNGVQLVMELTNEKIENKENLIF